MAPNYIVHGAGGIGCVIASRLATIGRKVQLVARGPHLQALQTKGLTLTQNTEGTWNLPAEESARELDLDDQTVILLAMKTDDTFDAVEQHSSIYRDTTPRTHLKKYRRRMAQTVFTMPWCP